MTVAAKLGAHHLVSCDPGSASRSLPRLLLISDAPECPASEHSPPARIASPAPAVPENYLTTLQ